MSPPPVSFDRVPKLDVLGAPTAILIDGAQTGGAFALVEVEVPPGSGIPPHVHERESETFMVVAGEIDLWCGGETRRLRAGDSLFGPRGVPHAPTNPGPGPARVRVIIAPAGFEQFFREADAAARRGPLTPEQATELLKPYGCLFLPPPA
jgi:mannose-6-phosphate isomerase-like protein (cupin superfamily)